MKVRSVVQAIHSSSVWSQGHNAIVIVWDENDYSIAPNKNHVLTTVETNFSPGGKSDYRFYTHFSLLRTLEGGLGLPCLNHACDPTTTTMSDLFGAH